MNATPVESPIAADPNWTLSLWLRALRRALPGQPGTGQKSSETLLIVEGRRAHLADWPETRPMVHAAIN